MVIDRKNVKKFLILLSLIFVVIAIYEITTIYAVFYTEGKGTLSKSISKWKITINETDIEDETVESFEISTLNVKNSNATNGKLAPGMEGTFEIIIEPNDTQVSVRYDITIDDSNLIGTDIKLVSVEETEVENEIVRTGEKVYTGVIPLTSIDGDYINTVEITFKWEDDGIGGDQHVDVDAIENNVIPIPITVKFSQYLEEADAKIEHID